MFPTFPQGATIPSILTAWEQAGGPVLARHNKWNLKVTHPIGYRLYAKRLRRFADEHLQGMLNVRQILRHHSLVPIHLSLYDTNDHADILKSRNTWYLTDRIYTNVDAARLCPLCVEEDTNQYGCGHWRREHQLRHVSICSRHGVALHDRCVTPGCDAPLGQFIKLLPGQPCPACKRNPSIAVKPVVTCDGYVSFCKLFTDALEMGVPEITPANRPALFAFGLTQCKGQPADLEPMLLDWLGERAPHTLNAIEDAIEWLRKPNFKHVVHQIAPSLILLAAFKRHVEGPPSAPPQYYWH